MKMHPELLDRLAREYVLGTLQGGARRRFATLARQQPAAAQALQAWGQRLGRLGEAVPAVQPSEALWQGLQQRLFGAAPKPVRWWQRAGFGLGGAFAGAALSALLLVPQLEQKKIDEESLPASYVGPGGMRFALGDGGYEPIGSRIIVLPQNAERAALRDPKSGFTDFVAKGSIAKGAALMAGGDGKTTACTICHGPAAATRVRFP